MLIHLFDLFFFCQQSHENEEDRSCDSIFSPTFHHQNEDDSDCLSKGTQLED